MLTFVQLSTDKTGTSDSLVTITANVFGALDQTQNHIKCALFLPFHLKAISYD